jgi:hypothetical protein
LAADWKVVPATLKHAVELAALMRPEDEAECLASGHETALDAVAASMERSSVCCALLLDGEVAALFGIVPAPGNTACAWALTGRAVSRRPVTFGRVSRRVVGAFLLQHEALFNYVDARYTAAIRWLRWLGFMVGTARELEPGGVPFCPVILRRSPWA